MLYRGGTGVVVDLDRLEELLRAEIEQALQLKNRRGAPRSVVSYEEGRVAGLGLALDVIRVLEQPAAAEQEAMA